MATRKRRYPKTGALTFDQARMLVRDLGGNMRDAAFNLARRGYNIYEAIELLRVPSETVDMHFICGNGNYLRSNRGFAVGVLPSNTDQRKLARYQPKGA